MIALCWTKGAPKGYSDLLPDEWFAKEVKNREVSHVIISPRGTTYAEAKCLLDVKGKTAVLDYANLGNNEKKIDIGQIKIVFDNPFCGQPIEVFWRDEGSRKYEKASIAISKRETDIEMQEGSPKLVTHLRRERSLQLRQMKIAAVRSGGGTLACEACNFAFADQYGVLGDDFCEVHHRVELSRGTRITGVDQLAILCSNCHRMIHKTNPMISVKNFARQHVRLRWC